MTTYLATLSTTRTENAINHHADKEMIQQLRVVGIANSAPACYADVRLYRSRSGDGASPLYCSLWITGDVCASGSGRATGYGYHKASAALQSAFDSAGVGITLAGDPSSISGIGEDAMRDALEAVALAVGAVGPVVVF